MGYNSGFKGLNKEFSVINSLKLLPAINVHLQRQHYNRDVCCRLQINTQSSDSTEAQAVEFKINTSRTGIKSSRYVASNAGSFLFTAKHQVFAAMKLSWMSNNNGNINILLLDKFA
jgi:hypothetical protein